MIDVVNCFQNTLQAEHERLIITAPPYYLSWFQKNYPEIKIEDSPLGKYIFQMIKELQGDKPIGRKWCLLIKKLLKSFGFVTYQVEPALYLFRHNDKMMIMNTSTDDFLCAYSHVETYASLAK